MLLSSLKDKVLAEVGSFYLDSLELLEINANQFLNLVQNCLYLWRENFHQEGSLTAMPDQDGMIDFDDLVEVGKIKKIPISIEDVFPVSQGRYTDIPTVAYQWDPPTLKLMTWLNEMMKIKYKYDYEITTITKEEVVALRKLGWNPTSIPYSNDPHYNTGGTFNDYSEVVSVMKDWPPLGENWEPMNPDPGSSVYQDDFYGQCWKISEPVNPLKYYFKNSVPQSELEVTGSLFISDDCNFTSIDIRLPGYKSAKINLEEKGGWQVYRFMVPLKEIVYDLTMTIEVKSPAVSKGYILLGKPAVEPNRPVSPPSQDEILEGYEIVGIEDSKDMWLFLNLVTAKFMVSLGTSRSSFVINDLPVTLNGAELSSRGQELLDKTMEVITENSDAFLSMLDIPASGRW